MIKRVNKIELGTEVNLGPERIKPSNLHNAKRVLTIEEIRERNKRLAQNEK